VGSVIDALWLDENLLGRTVTCGSCWRQDLERCQHAGAIFLVREYVGSCRGKE
jgi:hypothetical protein